MSTVAEFSLFQPEPVASWKNENFKGSNELLVNLNEDDLQLLSDSANSIMLATSPNSPELNISLGEINSEAAKLNNSDLFKKINDISEQKIIRGQGFVFIKRIPVESWGQHKSAIAFLLLSKLLGNLRSQNKLGHVLGHVVDLGLRSDDPNVRLYQTSERQTFHTDSADIVTLLCIRPAMEGGMSSIVSAGAIFNEMKLHRPDLLHRLFLPMATDRRGEIPIGQKPFFLIPVFSIHEGFLNVIYQRQYLDSAQRFKDAPQFTPLDIEALNYFDQLTNKPEMQLSIHLEPGDIQVLHNHSVLHDRSAFINHTDRKLRRHLLRAWICPLNDRPLPSVFADRFGSVTIGNRGGVQLEGINPIAEWDI